MSYFQKSSYNLNNNEFVSIIDELPLWSAPFGLKLLDVIKLKPNLTAIDIGFGLGFPLLEVAQRLGSTSKIYGIDPWKEAIKRTKIKIELLKLNNVELIEGFAENIPLFDGSVDLILSNNGINNVQNLKKVMRECSRIAKKSAQFAAAVNLDKTMIEFYEVFEKVLIERGLNEEVNKLKNHIYEKRKPIEELLNLFDSNDFKVVSVNHDSFKYRYLNGTVMFNHSFIKIAFLDCWLDLVPSELINDIFTEIEERLNTASEEKGELVLTVPFVIIDSIKI